MKQFYLFLSFILMLSANALQAQNDTIYFWKNGTLKLKESIKTADLDSITFKRPVAAIPNVTIGTQVWATKNLDVETYSDGTPIPYVSDARIWPTLTTGAWQYYNYPTALGPIYGKLYNWYAVAGIHDNDPNTPNKVLAPTGWHVPSNAEWTTVIDFLGGGMVAGGKMKEAGYTHWKSPNLDATNSSGFTGLPGGIVNKDGASMLIGEAGRWWSSSEEPNSQNAWLFSLRHDLGIAFRGNADKIFGHSVRCIKD